MGLSFFNRTRFARLFKADLLVLHGRACTPLGATISQASTPALTLHSLSVSASSWSLWKVSSSSSELLLASGLILLFSVPLVWLSIPRDL